MADKVEMNGITKTIVALVLGAIIAAGGFFTGNYTISEAAAVATDSGKASIACADLLKGQGYAVAEPPAPVTTTTTTTVTTPVDTAPATPSH